MTSRGLIWPDLELPSAPGDLWGLQAISRCLGVCPRTAWTYLDSGRILAIRRRRGPRWTWYSSEDLLRASLVAWARADQEARAPGRAARLVARERGPGGLTGAGDDAPAREAALRALDAELARRARAQAGSP